MSIKAALLLALICVVGIVVESGFMWVDVRERGPDGHHIVLPVPMVLARMGVACVPSDVFADGAAQMQAALPAVGALCDALAKMPDAVLVDVQSTREQVQIAKRGGSLTIDVNDSDATVHLSVPLASAGDLMKDLARKAARASQAQRSASLRLSAPATPR